MIPSPLLQFFAFNFAPVLMVTELNRAPADAPEASYLCEAARVAVRGIDGYVSRAANGNISPIRQRLSHSITCG